MLDQTFFLEQIPYCRNVERRWLCVKLLKENCKFEKSPDLKKFVQVQWTSSSSKLTIFIALIVFWNSWASLTPGNGKWPLHKNLYCLTSSNKNASKKWPRLNIKKNHQKFATPIIKMAKNYFYHREPFLREVDKKYENFFRL